MSSTRRRDAYRGLGHGPGNSRRRIVRRFSRSSIRSDNPARERSKGLGLGLAIVQRLSTLLGHSIDLKSRPGRGSMFSIAVPHRRPTPRRQRKILAPSLAIDPRKERRHDPRYRGRSDDSRICWNCFCSDAGYRTIGASPMAWPRSHQRSVPTSSLPTSIFRTDQTASR